MTKIETGSMTFEQVIESEDFEHLCTSLFCAEDMDRGAHIAHWLVLFTCGHDAYWCHERMREYDLIDVPEFGGSLCPLHSKPIGVNVSHSVPLRSI